MTHILIAASSLLRPVCRLLSLLALFGLLAATTLAQGTRSSTDGSTPLGLQPGQPAGSFALSGFDNVNPYNGNLNFHLPLLQIGGRGAAQMTMMLAIDSKGWRVKNKDVFNAAADCGAEAGIKCVDGGYYATSHIPEPNRWSPSAGYGAGMLFGRSTGMGSNTCGGATSYGLSLTRLTFITADGTEYELRDQLYAGEPQPVTGGLCNGARVAVSRGTVFTSTDGNAASFISDQPINDKAYAGPEGTERIYPSGYLLLKDGTRYRIDNGQITWMRDRNGNLISFSYDGAKRVTTITDSLNRQVTVEYDVTDVAPYGLCDRITYRGFGGAQRVIRVSKTTLSNVLRPGFTVKTYAQLFPELNGSSNTTWNPSKASFVWMPDDRKYSLFYNSYGELSRVELPTGGAIEYDYNAGSGCIDEMGSRCTDTLAEFPQIFRRVTTRRVYTDAGTTHSGGTLDGKMTFSDPGGSCALYPCEGDAAITVDHLNSTGGRLLREKHYYYGNAVESIWQGPTSYPSWKQGREYKTEVHDSASTATNPKLLRVIENTWAQRTPLPAWIAAKSSELQPPFDVRLTQAVTTLMDTGTDSTTGAANPHQVSKQTFTYDQYNNQTDVYEYDYGDGAVGPFRRRTHTDYLTTNPINGADYDSLISSATSGSMTSFMEASAGDPCLDCLGAKPTAEAGGPYSGQTGVSITFNGGGSSDDVGVVSYRWNFGDGTTVNRTDALAWHQYSQAGTYTVTLTVYDEDGLSDVDTTTATISVSPTPTPTPTPTPPGPTPTPTPPEPSPTPTPPPPDTTTGSVDLNATIHLRNLPTGQWVSSDVAGNVKKAITTYEYDNYTADTGSVHAALLARSGISGLDASFTSARKTRGNVTAVSRTLIQENNREIETYQQYDVAGNVTKTIDARGKATTFYFDDRFGAPDDHEAQANDAPTELTQAGKRSYAFATQVKNALNHLAYTQFDYYTGKPVNAEDANGTVYSGYYSDALDRPTKLVSAYADATARTQTKFIYDDTNRTIRTTSDRSVYDDDLLKSELLYDRLGRTVETRQYEDATNYIRVEQQYDGLGRVIKKSNPYRPPAETAQMTSITYDELGRVTQVMTPDSAKVNTTYKGNTTTVRDQALKQRQSTVDALGRLIEVVEDPNGLAYQTSYEYDVLDNLLKVIQGGQSRNFTYDSLKRLTQAVNPESGTLKYEYDDNGNLTKKTDPRKVTTSPLVYLETSFTYDVLNRVTAKNYNDGTPDVLYKYDNQTLPAGAPGATIFERGASTGRLVSVTYGGTAAGTYYGYDELGRVIERVQQSEGTNYEVNASYNRAGAMLTETYPANPSTTTRRVVTHTFDGAGRLRSLSTAGASVANISYASHGALESQNYGTLLHQISYNNRLQPTQIKLEKTTDPTIVPLNISYGYGTTTNNGNVLSSTITAGADIWTQTFTYDPLNRLDIAKEVKSAATQWSQNFDYDQYGNRCIRVSASTSCTPDISPANNNRLNGVSYDAAGNQTSMVRGTETLTLTYDAENHVKAVGADTAYVYDGEGKRVSKLMGENVRMVYGISGEMVAEFDGTSGELKKEYIYGASGLAATIATGEGTRYVTADHLGSPRIITNASGAVLSRHDYQPFGEELFAGIGNRTAAQGYSATDGLRKKFTSKERRRDRIRLLPRQILFIHAGALHLS